MATTESIQQLHQVAKASEYVLSGTSRRIAELGSAKQISNPSVKKFFSPEEKYSGSRE